MPRTYKITDVTIEVAQRCPSLECPEYALTLRGDGTGTYVGRKNVTVQGRRDLKVQREALIRILGSIYRSAILEYERPPDTVDSIKVDGAGTVTVARDDLVVIDSPQADLSFKVGGCVQNVSIDALAPRRAWMLIHDIEYVSEIDRLIGAD